MTEINFEDEYNKLKYIINSGKINDHIFKDLYNGGYINIRDINGATTLINISYRDTIENLMDKIQHKNGMPKYKQILKFGGITLESHRTLYHYKIPVGGIVLLVNNINAYYNYQIDKMSTKILKEINEDQFEIETVLSKNIL